MSVESVNNIKQIAITNIVTLVIAISSSYFMFQGQKTVADGGIYSSTLDRMRVQDSTISNLQAQVAKANLRILDLEAQVRREVKHADVLQSYIDSIPAPAWIKRINADGVFEMYLINKKYSEVYRIGKTQYQGRTDYDIWPKDLADKWQANDRAVFYSGGSMRSVEDIPVRGVGLVISETKRNEVLKFVIDLPRGEQGVGGLVLGDLKK